MLRISVLSALLLSLFLSVASGCSEPDPKKGPDFNEEAYNDPLKAMQGMQGTKPGTDPSGKRLPKQ